MGEHAAFLLLLAATLTLSSEVSLAEKPQPVAANRYLGQTLCHRSCQTLTPTPPLHTHTVFNLHNDY